MGSYESCVAGTSRFSVAFQWAFQEIREKNVYHSTRKDLFLCCLLLLSACLLAISFERISKSLAIQIQKAKPAKEKKITESCAKAKVNPAPRMSFGCWEKASATM